jgi:hypothetical protein
VIVTLPRPSIKAFSSEVDAGSREENASNRAFSSEVDAGSREENALKQKHRASVPIPSERKRSRRSGLVARFERVSASRIKRFNER